MHGRRLQECRVQERLDFNEVTCRVTRHHVVQAELVVARRGREHAAGRQLRGERVDSGSVRAHQTHDHGVLARRGGAYGWVGRRGHTVEARRETDARECACGGGREGEMSVGAAQGGAESGAGVPSVGAARLACGSRQYDLRAEWRCNRTGRGRASERSDPPASKGTNVRRGGKQAGRGAAAALAVAEASSNPPPKRLKTGVCLWLK